MNAKRTLAGLVGLWALAIGCNNDVSGPRTGAARVTIATAGADLAPHGYMVSADSGAPLAVPVNGSATILGLKTGSHSVALGGLGNCAVNGANPRSVDVVAGRTTDVSFAITCATPAVTGKIAFTSDRDGTEQIYVMNADGSSPTRLTNGPANNRRPAWSPDGKRIVFASNRDGDFEIYVMDADGSSPTRLTKYGPPWEVGLAAWSPDGTRIAYFEEICDPAPDGCGGSTQIMNADGSDDHGVVAGGSRPAWSPDGGRIAFGTGQIWVLYLDGSGHTEVIDPRDIGGQHIEPAWSPEGAKIVFASTGCYACSNSTLDIYVMNADGSGVVRLTHTGSDHSPAWRP
jgi:dipeptidyl aminopeptidase/acylaminoacyl peptidase